MTDQTNYDDFLRFKAFKGFQDRRLPMTEPYMSRLSFELDVIRQTKFAAYFLIVADLCRFMRESGILFNVRGSGCGSVVVWSLGISHRWLDPLKLKLPFERFLNPARVTNPDLDIDIIDTRRHEVVDYTIKKYGNDRTARIITFGTLGAKAAVQDVARAMQDRLGDTYQETARKISACIPTGADLDDALKASEYLREQKAAMPEIFEYVAGVEGKVRHASIHAAGTIIAPDKLTKFMPLFFDGSPENREPDGWVPTTQWDMYDCEKRGLLKMDYLGLKTLRVIDDTVKAINFIRQQQGVTEPFVLDEIPQDDAKAWQLMANGELAGVFQVERQFVRNFAKRMGLMRRDPWALAVLISIIRPGMMDAGTTEVYLRRAGGQEEAVPLHPLLKETLKDNFGLLVFQEDCMLVCQDMAGFTMSEADEVRYGIGKKKPEVLAKMKPKFIEGAVKKGATPEQAEAVWKDMETFGRYGFNRAHAAAYGVVTAYQTAFLKANHTLPYMTFLINSESGVGNKELGYNYKVAEYVEESRRLGITVTPPCVKRSGRLCRLVPAGNEIRFGLEMIKGVSAEAVQWILTRARCATSFKQFMLECFEVVKTDEGVHKHYSRIGKGDLESLVYSGALDVFGVDRSKMLAMLPNLIKLCGKYHEQHCKVLDGKGERMRLRPEKLLEDIQAYDLPDEAVQDAMTLETQLDHERRVTGCYLSRSPFAPYQHVIDQYCNTSVADLATGDHPDPAVFAGLITRVATTVTKSGKSKGQDMAFLTFSGISGEVEAVCFAGQWATLKNKVGGVERGKVYIVQLTRGRDDRGFVVNDMTRLSNCGFDQRAA